MQADARSATTTQIAEFRELSIMVVSGPFGHVPYHSFPTMRPEVPALRQWGAPTGFQSPSILRVKGVANVCLAVRARQQAIGAAHLAISCVLGRQTNMVQFYAKGKSLCLL